MTPKNIRKQSKFLSYVLRHHPERIGLTLDQQGWVVVKDLIKALRNTGWDDYTKDMLNDVVETNNKKRFAYSENGLKIRASQGHSVDIDLGLEATVPPDRLYHGTITKFLDSIFKKGLTKGQRQHVHLSKDVETARNVGLRRGKPIVLTVLAKEMHLLGYQFYVSANGVWLVDHVPVTFVKHEI